MAVKSHAPAVAPCWFVCGRLESMASAVLWDQRASIVAGAVCSADAAGCVACAAFS